MRWREDGSETMSTERCAVKRCLLGQHAERLEHRGLLVWETSDGPMDIRVFVAQIRIDTM